MMLLLCSRVVEDGKLYVTLNFEFLDVAASLVVRKSNIQSERETVSENLELNQEIVRNQIIEIYHVHTC